jgi:hypothetical protein
MTIHRDPQRSYITIDRQRLLHLLHAPLAAADLDELRRQVTACRDLIAASPEVPAPAVPQPGGAASVGEPRLLCRRDVLLAELDQVLDARTVRRAHHYLRRLERGLTETRTNGINDINLNRWKAYDEIITDSLWIVDRRDTSGSHEAWYWGNFIPRIPRQMILRYTQCGEWVLDPFAGSGTTLIECRRLGRHGLGIELNPDVAERAAAVVAEEPNPHQTSTDVVVGDSRTVAYDRLLAERGVESAQLLILHPPYHDIIRFSDAEADLSNAPSVDDFVADFARVVRRSSEVLDPGRYMAVVIGDKYQDGQWIPLGFRLMQAVLDQDFTLKSVVVKNFDGTRGKRNQQALWRYRALAGGFYVFKHEYIFIFQA